MWPLTGVVETAKHGLDKGSIVVSLIQRELQGCRACLLSEYRVSGRTQRGGILKEWKGRHTAYEPFNALWKYWE